MANDFDVWLLKANTVYKKVPYGVATDWVEQGRLSADDKIRPAGVETVWVRVADHPLLSDFLFTAPTTPRAGSQFSDIEMDVGKKKYHAEEDDDVDMIPLIDISMVLLIFFMMTATVAAVSSVDLPATKYASEIGKDPKAFTVSIDKRSEGSVYYSLRVGDNLPDNEDNNLSSKDEVISHLRNKLGSANDAPEVRIACNKELPRALVHEIAKELHKLKEERLIAYYGAEVVEQK